MKHAYNYILLSALLICNSAHLFAEKRVSYLDQIGIRNEEVVKEGKEIRVSLQFDLGQLKIKTQHTIALTPVLVSRDGSRERVFPPVVIDGRTRNMVYLRARQFESVDLPPYHDESAREIIRRRNGQEQTCDYQATAPYERWMLNGRIELREEIHGCVNCAQGDSDQLLLGSVLPEFFPDYRLDTIAPKPEPVKVREETRTARLQFRRDSYKILPDFKNNRAELDTVANSILLVQNNPDVEITRIFITGYASPEGTVTHNLKLSENRARAFAEHICRENGIDPGMLDVAWKGEDWKGLRLALDQFPELPKRDEVYRIIDEYPDDRDLCEKKLRELTPPTIYQQLLEEVYPLLRRNEYRIVYNVRNFDLTEARRMVNERPDLLSLTEMYKVAGSYEKGSEEYEQVMRTAARYFPDSPAVVNDRALDAISVGDYARAVALLEESAVTPGEPTLLNTLGVAYAEIGEPYKAEALFLQAAEAGSEVARHNLAQIQQVIDQL